MSCDPGGHCITCSDEAIEVTVLTVDEDQDLAVCTDRPGHARDRRRPRSSPLSGPPSACSSTPALAIATGPGALMKYVDEYRDAHLGQALATQIAR